MHNSAAREEQLKIQKKKRAFQMSGAAVLAWNISNINYQLIQSTMRRTAKSIKI